MTTLILPREVGARIEAEAGAAWPRECCGLLEGTRAGSAIVLTKAHAVRNVSAAADAFEIDPAAHIALLRELRGTGRQIVGCYHSHPNGKAEPSGRDGQDGSETGFVWLIAALTAPGSVTTRAFLRTESGFAPVSMMKTASLDPARGPRL